MEAYSFVIAIFDGPLQTLAAALFFVVLLHSIVVSTLTITLVLFVIRIA